MRPSDKVKGILNYVFSNFDWDNYSMSHDDNLTCDKLTKRLIQDAAQDHSHFSTKNFPLSYRSGNNPAFHYLYQKVWKKVMERSIKLTRRPRLSKLAVKQETSPLPTLIQTNKPEILGSPTESEPDLEPAG